MTVNADHDVPSNKSQPMDAAGSIFSGGALEFLDRAGNAMESRFEKLYSTENLDRVFRNVENAIPEELRDFLRDAVKTFFNLAGGAWDEEDAPNLEYQTIGELFGAGGAKSDAVRADANFAQRDEGNFASTVTLGTGTGGPNTTLNGITYKDGKAINDDSDDEDVKAFRETVEGLTADQQAHLKEWESSRHSYAGLDMTGEDWEKLKSWMNDPENDEAIDEALMAETGKSFSAVKRMREKTRRHSDLMEKIATNTATAAERAEFDKLDKDDDVRTTYRVAQQVFDAKQSAPLPAAEANAEAAAQSVNVQSESVEQRGNLIASRADFNAEPITPKYNAAASGTAPEPEPVSPKADSPKPAQIAAASPPAVGNGMNASLDMG